MVQANINSVLQKHINNAPDWVNWVAQDEHGYWRGFDNMPVVGLIPSGYPGDDKMYEDWLSDIEHGVTEITILKLFKDKPNPEWKKTCRRVRRKLKR